MIMALPKIISILAPKIFKVIKNLKSKEGGKGNFNMKLLGKDIAIDVAKIALIGLLIYALITGNWEAAEKGKEFLGT